MLYLAGKYGTDFALYKSMEFLGPGVETLSMDNRMTMSDQRVEVGAKVALFECDERTRNFLKRSQVTSPFDPVTPDKDAVYDKTYDVDLSSITPQIVAPHTF